MKKVLLMAFAAAVAVVAAGCKTTGVELAQYNPVAIMTVYSNPGVPWYEERSAGASGGAAKQTDEGILTGAVNRVLNKGNPETATAQERIDGASALLSERLRDAGIEVIDPTVLKNCSAYKNAGRSFFDYLGNTLPAVGYDSLTSSNKRLNRAMCDESGAKAVLYAQFRFQKVMVKAGVRNKGVAARAVLLVYGTDSDGKKLFNREYSAVSSDYAELVHTSSWDKAKVCSLFPDVVNRVVTAFLLDFAYAGESARADEAPTRIALPRAEQRGDGARDAPAGTTADDGMSAASASTAGDNGAAPARGTEPVATSAPEAGAGSAAARDAAPADGADDAVLAEKRATAAKLLQRGMSAEEAADITGLPLEQVRALE